MDMKSLREWLIANGVPAQELDEVAEPPVVRDIGEAVLVAMNVMLWFSAVPYPINVIPEQWRSLMEWNPFYILLHPTIMLAYEGVLPDAMSMIKVLVLMLISTVFGYTFYRLCRRNFIYYL